MKQAISTFSYDFNKSYYENYWANRYGAMRNAGEMNDIMDRLWWNYNETQNIDGTNIDYGVDIKSFVQTTYNGQEQLCMLDALAQEIFDVLGSVFGCGLARALFKIFDWFTDLFGSFICTATVETLGTECGQEFLQVLKDYRDKEMMTYREGLNMIRYYRVLGPKVVEAINADIESHAVYTYLWITYIAPLPTYIENGEKDKVIYIYFKMMDDMIKKYDIETSDKLDNWMCETLTKYELELEF